MCDWFQTVFWFMSLLTALTRSLSFSVRSLNPSDNARLSVRCLRHLSCSEHELCLHLRTRRVSLQQYFLTAVASLPVRHCLNRVFREFRLSKLFSGLVGSNRYRGSIVPSSFSRRVNYKSGSFYKWVVIFVMIWETPWTE